MHTFDFRRFTPAALGLAAVLLASAAGAQGSVPRGAVLPALAKAGHIVVQPTLQMNSSARDEKVILNPKVLGNPLAFRPIVNGQAISQEAYMQLKQQAASNFNLAGRPGAGGIGADGITPFSAAALKYSTFGIDEVAAAGPAGYNYLWEPPDVQAAFGISSGVQPANSGVRVYNKGASLSTSYTTDLNSFLAEPAVNNGYLTTSFDPDSYYDPAGHFVVSAAEFPYLDANGAFHMKFDLAVSSTNDARGGWGVYQIDGGQLFAFMTRSGWAFVDYPHIGFDQGNIIFTANVFDDYYGYYEGAVVFILNKGQAYSLVGASGNWWGYNNSSNSGFIPGTLMPPRVITQGSQGYSYLEVAYNGGNPSIIAEYTLLGTAGSGPSLVGPYTGVATGLNLSFPPLATDPGGSPIDTLDGRIQHSPTQNGDHMFATTTVNDGGFPTVQVYEFNGYSGGLIGQTPKYIYGGTSSDDFNPSIAANYNDSWVLTWNSTGLSRTAGPNQYFEQTRITSFQPTTDTWGAANVKGKPVKTSPYADRMGRNGDYSSVQVDPNNPRVFWFANQLVSSNNSYGAGSLWATCLGYASFTNP